MTATSKLLFGLVMALLLAPAWSAAFAQTNTSPIETQGFNVLGTGWGTSTAAAYPAPGSQNVPITVTLQYFFEPEASYVSASFQLPTGMTNADGTSSSTASWLTGSVAVGSTVSMTFYVNIASNAPSGVYNIPMTIDWGVVPVGGDGIESVNLEQDTSVMVNLLGAPSLQILAQQSSLTPGQVNNVRVSITNQGTGGATDISTAVSVTSTATQATSQTINVLTKVPMIDSLAAGASQNFNMTIFAATSAAGSSVSLSFAFSYTNSYGAAATSTQQIGVYVNEASKGSLTFQVTRDSLSPGTTNTIPLVLSNGGAAGVTQVYTTATSSSQSVSILNQLPLLQTLTAGASQNETLEIYVPTSAAGSALSLTLTTTFDDASGYGESLTQSISLYVSNSASDPANVAVSTKVGTLDVGQQSNVEFVVTNSGTSPLYSPSFTFTVSSPLIIMGNSPYSEPGATLAPGKSLIYNVSLASSPSATPGFYSGTLGVSYQDQFGTSTSQSFPIGITLDGTVLLVLQSSTVSQSGGELTVTGTLLNEGTASAYYASVTGVVGASSGTATYMGEIDPNTPIPFSITIPYTATGAGAARTTAGSGGAAPTTSTSTSTTTQTGSQSSFTRTSQATSTTSTANAAAPDPPATSSTASATTTTTSTSRSFTRASGSGSASTSITVVVDMVYKDGFGNQQTYSWTVPATLASTSSALGATSAAATQAAASQKMLSYAAYGVVGAVGATAMIGALMVRRTNKKRRAEAGQEEHGGDETVI